MKLTAKISPTAAFILVIVYWSVFSSILIFSSLGLSVFYAGLHVFGALAGIVMFFVLWKLRVNYDKDIKKNCRDDVTALLSNYTPASVGRSYFSEVSRNLNKLINADCVIIGEIVNTAGKTSIESHCLWTSDDIIHTNIAFDINGTIYNDVVSRNEKFVYVKKNAITTYSNDTFLKDLGAKSVAAIALRDDENNVRGVMCCYWTKNYKISYNVKSIMTMFSDRAGTELARQILEKQLKYESTHDYLTNLPNRVHAITKIKQIINEQDETTDSRVGPGTEVFLLDIDGFKEVNDEYGHLAGDHLLKTISERIKKVVRGQDFASRFGGDEFLIIKRSNLATKSFVERLQKVISSPIDINGSSITVNASIGSVILDETMTANEVIKYADFCMYVAKTRGKNQHVGFTRSLYMESVKGRYLEKQIQIAILNDDFYIVVQPIYKLSPTDTNVSVHGEVLARWKHGNYEIPPTKFISVAEKHGLIVPLGDAVINKTINLIKHIKEETNIDISLSINCSVQQLKDLDFAKKLQEKINKNNLKTSQIVIEITESVVTDTVTEVTIHKLTQLGFKIVIDDFGTGFSSLAYIDKLPASIVKLDQRFVRNIDKDKKKQKIVDAVSEMCRAYNYEVIAEGVETKGEFDYIKQAKYDYVQGFLMSKPLTENAHIEFLKELQEMKNDEK